MDVNWWKLVLYRAKIVFELVEAGDQILKPHVEKIILPNLGQQLVSGFDLVLGELFRVFEVDVLKLLQFCLLVLYSFELDKSHNVRRPFLQPLWAFVEHISFDVVLS